MDNRQRSDLDNHITGHYGEDQFVMCPFCSKPITTPGPIRSGDLSFAGSCFGIRIIAGCSNGCAELYIEDDDWWHFVTVFDRTWLRDLADTARRALGDDNG